MKIIRNKYADDLRIKFPMVGCYEDSGSWFLIAKYPPMAYGLPRRWILGKSKVSEISAWEDAWKRFIASPSPLRRAAPLGDSCEETADQ